MNAASCIKLKIWRFSPELAEVGHFQDFELVAAEPLSVMALLGRVHEMDPSFACRTSTCFKGMCGSCLIRCNGKEVYGCTTLLSPGDAAVIEPSARFRSVRDVVVDFSQPAPVAKEG
jgi:succinate dehydrogenase / fumarate reductase, iron-sulfur subunit